MKFFVAFNVGKLKSFHLNLQIVIFNRMNGMQQEINQLKGNVSDMKKNMGFDDELFDDLDDFDKKVSFKVKCARESSRHQSMLRAEGRKTFSDVV